MEPLGRFLEDRGHVWHNLTIPGHGTTPEDLRTKKWMDWTAYVGSEISKKLAENDTVVFTGLSMGGTLTLWALENFPELKGGVTLSAPVEILSWPQRLLTILPIGWWISRTDDDIRDINDPEQRSLHRAYETFHTDSVKELQKLVKYTKRNLQRITQPILVVHSTKDKSIPLKNAEYIHRMVSSDQKGIMIVERSRHVLTRDLDRNEIFSKINDFLLTL